MPPTPKLKKALFSGQGEKIDIEAQLPWDCGAVTCHLERKIWHYPGIPLPWGSARGEREGIITEAEHGAGHCVFLELKVTVGPLCLQTPNTSGLFYQLSHNALSTHTQLKKNFPTLFYLECFKFLRKLVPFSFWLLFNVNLWVVGAERGLYLNSLDIHYHLTETLGKPAKPYCLGFGYSKSPGVEKNTDSRVWYYGIRL